MRVIGQRIVVVGTTGSGKTTLARQLAERLRLPYSELDALHWNPDWQPAPKPIFRERVEQAFSGTEWVTDGNYSVVRDIVWSRADTIVWLDYSLPLILGRLFRRTVRRIRTQEELWNGNRERLSAQFTRESLVLWALKTYRKKRQEYPVLFQRPEYSHLNVIHLRSPRATEQWLRSLLPRVEPV